jgi:penicillin-binding protein 1A
MEPENGHVKAYVGGIDYRHFKFDQVTKSRRQIGSTIKPFIYCIAMQNGLSPCTKVPNVEVTFKINKGKNEELYTPKYSSTKLDGEMITLKQGLANSLNQISAWVLKQYAAGYNNNYDGVKNIVDIAKSMGVNSPIDAVPSICVGSAEVLISELVASYCAFANQGKGIRPVYITSIKDKNGNTLANFLPQRFDTKINEETTYLMIELMKGVVNEGTGIRLRYKYELTGEMAGKTGTTNNNSDGWFMGMTPQLVSGVWVGGEERSIRFRYMDYGQGAVLALPIWALYMQKVYKDTHLPYNDKATFKKPANLSVELDCNEFEKNNRHEDFNN